MEKLVVDCSTGEQTVVPLTAEEEAQRQADEHAAALRPPPPDVPGFLIATMTALGKPRGREILAAYPDVHMALREPFNYAIALAGIDEALADLFLTQAEYDTIMAEWDAHHLPR